MSSSESSDEDTERFKEAADPDFISDSLFDKTKKSEKKCEEKEKSVSRNKNRDGLNVTPEFQNFVAKHLSVMLDKEIEEICSSSKEKKKKRVKGGVRLLGSSSDYLTCEEDNENNTEKLSRRQVFTVKPKSISDDVDDKDKVTEAAVSFDWLTKESTKGWEKSTKGKVLVVKNNVCVDA